MVTSVTIQLLPTFLSMVSDLSLRLHAGSRRRRDQPQPIVAIVAWSSVAPVARRQGDVGHLPRGDEVHAVLAARHAGREGGQETSHRGPEHGRLVGGIHAVAVE